MNVETIREYCLSKRGVTESFPFDDVSLVIKVMNKMFALIDLEEANHIALKCDPEKAIELREHYSGIEGAYHFNKKYWNSVRFDSDVDDKLMKAILRLNIKFGEYHIIDMLSDTEQLIKNVEISEKNHW